MSHGFLLEKLELTGLTLAPSQVLGGVRLVPVLKARERTSADLRLSRRSYDEPAMVVSLDGELMAPGLKYISYVPHGLVVSFTEDGAPVAAFGAQLEARDGKRLGKGLCAIRVAHRMVRREEPGRLRLLPLHLAMEGFLAHCFGGPEIAWSDYSNQAISSGLDPRMEISHTGRAMRGLDDALRVFEIHDDQVGVLIFVADALASAFVLPTHDDYRALHRSLLEDFYGDIIVEYARFDAPTPMAATIDAARVDDLAGLRRELANVRSEWAGFHGLMAEGLIGKRIRSERLYRAGPFQLQRFMTNLDPSTENHIGEAIVRDDGSLEYLKTFRLSSAQTRRAFLLSKLAEHGWNLDKTAASMRVPKEELVRRMQNAGFGYLLREHVLKAAQKKTR